MKSDICTKNTIQSFIIHYVNSLVASCWALVFLMLPPLPNHLVHFCTLFRMQMNWVCALNVYYETILGDVFIMYLLNCFLDRNNIKPRSNEKAIKITG